eukprot:m.38330 g.38330  ORF g.38330 m.38330 type:complete len:381 (+) comp5641_c0_seq1:63-1205(+)
MFSLPPPIDVFHQQEKRRRLRACQSVTTQAYRDDGTLLAAGSNDGKMCVWNVERALAQETPLSERGLPINTIDLDDVRKSSGQPTGHDCGQGVAAMASHKNILFAAQANRIRFWNWDTLTSSDTIRHRPEAEACVPSCTLPGTVEVNSLAVDDEAGTLLAGAGDGNVHMYDVGTGKLTGQLSGHSDMVLSVTVFPRTSRRYATASEDGTVKLWDARQRSATDTLDPTAALAADDRHREHKSRGRWIASVAVDATGTWMACGGGVVGTVWHTKTKTLTAALMSTSNRSHGNISEVAFAGTGGSGVVRTLGSDPCIRLWSLCGDLVRKVPTTTRALSASATSAVSGPLAMTTFCGADCRLSVYLHGLTKASFDFTFTGGDSS